MSLTKFTSRFFMFVFLGVCCIQAKILINRQQTIQEVDDKCLVVEHNYVGFSGCKETVSDTSLPPLSKYTTFNNVGGRPVKLTQSQPLLVKGQQQSSWFGRVEMIFGAVFGKDSRTKVSETTVSPYSGIGQISDDCTGAKIGPRHILTAAHCVVYSYRALKGIDWMFTPGRDSKHYKPFGEYEWVVAYVPDEFLNNGQSFDYNYDYAIVILQQDLSDEISTLKFDFECHHPSVKVDLNIAGYPEDKPESTMWETNCSNLYIKCDWTTFSHTCDTKRGMSGSPMFAKIQKDDGTMDYVIYGIHSAAFHSNNHAIFMSHIVQAQLKQWLQIFNPQTQIDDHIELVSDQTSPVLSSATKATPDAVIAKA